MGVPKFFRWMSERYPAISQLIAENRIPEFDCLYLDMNGIIHNCTHNDSDSPTFRMTEDKMFIAIFNYIEHLFGKIKPKKLFFMAIDGVAPRAKMNQQRSRRFRTALDAEMAREKAIRSGIEMPKESAFDSNCISPGTEFMAKLSAQLKYFVNKKVSEDVDWQGVEIVLSGHEVPGEGEHKIMEYIRQAKAQPDYDPNVRHCLYGLDADLVMLGLLSHDPHFCLLREEVTFGRQSQKKSKELEHQNFYLMHLCMVREYLELEFQELKEPGVLDFEFDMEAIIDDFILMAFFVGNDFLPNLPNLHINEGALAAMFQKYKEILPMGKGYINERGVINLERLATILDALSTIEYRFFEAEYSDASWIKAKHKSIGVDGNSKKSTGSTITPQQKQIFKSIKKYVTSRNTEHDQSRSNLDFSPTLPARDRKFVQELADDLHIEWKTVENEQGERHMRLNFPATMNNNDDDDDDEEEGGEGEEEEEAHIATLRVIKRYDTMKVEEIDPEQVQQNLEKKYEERFRQWKNKYYQDKFGWGLDNEEEIKDLTETYVQGLQWVLYYYYQGVASWPWFYKFHYSPMISDVKKGLGANMKFKLGQPFKPFQQLMGIMPDRSKTLLPGAYHELMTSANSPIIDFYPRDFDLDMNGKKMEWEAVVKIPFIDEKRLLQAMASKEAQLSPDEQARNTFGVTTKFTYSAEVDFIYPTSLTDIFPDLPHCHCVENVFDLPIMEGLEPYIGLVEGVKVGIDALAGFPSLKTLEHAGALGFHGINVFQQDSRNESMVVTLLDSDMRTKVEAAKIFLGKRVHVGYPFLQEALVTRVSDELFDYNLPPVAGGPVLPVHHSPLEIDQWRKKVERIEGNYSKRYGMIIGPVESMMHVDMLKGLKMTDEGATVKEFAQISGQETDYASQLVVDEVVSMDQRFLEHSAKPITEDFPIGTRAFFLGEFSYGKPLEVVSHEGTMAGVWISTVKGPEPDFGKKIAEDGERLSPYTPSYAVARQLQFNALALSKITSSFSVMVDEGRVNLGLNLKFEAKKLKVLGYSRKGPTGWEFSQKAVDLLQQYMIRFPEFIAGLQQRPQGDLFVPTDFYPAEIAKDKIKEIQAWLNSIEAKKFERVPLEAEQLDSDVVKEIEKAADDNLRNEPAPVSRKIKAVPRKALLKPADAEHRLGNQAFGLGDRVVYVQESGRVPIATRGTVVGMTRNSRTTLLDIVFDVTFMSGTSLGDRCSPFRGSTVPVATVLNLSSRQLIAQTKAGLTQQPQTQPQPLTIRGYGQPGQGQLREATAPPPLRGSFRGAIASQTAPNRGLGMARGRGRSSDMPHPVPQTMPVRNHPMPQTNDSRGRSSYTNGFVHRPRAGLGSQPVNRQGYTPLDRSNDDGGVVPNNPNFRPQSYSNVPPPASLDSRGRGRGRGSSRGEGRGRGINNGGRGRTRGAPTSAQV